MPRLLGFAIRVSRFDDLKASQPIGTAIVWQAEYPLLGCPARDLLRDFDRQVEGRFS